MKVSSSSLGVSNCDTTASATRIAVVEKPSCCRGHFLDEYVDGICEKSTTVHRAVLNVVHKFDFFLCESARFQRDNNRIIVVAESSVSEAWESAYFWRR